MQTTGFGQTLLESDGAVLTLLRACLQLLRHGYEVPADLLLLQTRLRLAGELGVKRIMKISSIDHIVLTVKDMEVTIE